MAFTFFAESKRATTCHSSTIPITLHFLVISKLRSSVASMLGMLQNKLVSEIFYRCYGALLHFKLTQSIIDRIFHIVRIADQSQSIVLTTQNDSMEK